MVGKAPVEALQKETGLADRLAAHVAASLALARRRQGQAIFSLRDPHRLPSMNEVHNSMRPDSLEAKHYNLLAHHTV